MDRRKFIKIGVEAVAAGAVSRSVVLQAAEGSVGQQTSNGTTVGYSIVIDSVSEPSTAECSLEPGEAGKEDLLVSFLGTGAADWNGVDERGELRRLSSVLLDNLIMEATMGIDHNEDFRIYTHSSVGTVLRTAHVLQSTGRLNAPQGQPVYIIHMARTLHDTQAQLGTSLPSPLRAAYDGLEVIFRG